MQIKTRFYSWLLGVLTALVWGTQLAGAEPGQPERLHFSTVPTDGEVFGARVFDEPLVPLSAKANAREDRALADALQAYANRAVPDDCSSLANFAARFPESRWTGPLLTHLGTEYYNYGYFSKALDVWEQAWKLSEKSHYAPAKPEADRALGELARMYSKLGRISELSQLLDSTKDRDLSGPGTQLIHAANEALWVMQNKPDYAFQCGPMALERILRVVDPSKANSPLLQEFKSPTNGFCISEVAGFSDQLGMHYQMAFRSPGAAMIVPAVVHWKVGHYAAITDQKDGKVLAQDYTFRGSIWMSQDALDNEASGYFLVPPGPLPAGWRKASADEVRSVRGKGFTNGGDPNATGCNDTVCGGTGCGNCNPCGMAAYTMHALLASLTLQDTPIRFFSPRGPEVFFTATYNQLEANQPSIFPYSNLGAKWTCNWISYITDNPSSPGSDLTMYEDGGGTLMFTGYNPTTQSYAGEAMTHAILTRVNPSNYDLLFPNGTRREFAKSDGSLGSSRRIFLTQVIDAASNAVTINYDAQFRITNIVNAINQATTFSYTNATYPNAITSVTDPFGRSAYFQYNASGLLGQITDTLGLTSQFAYSTNQFVNALTTPYGSTVFYTGTTNGGTYLQATDPLGGTELLEYSQASGIPHSLPASDVPHGLSTFNLFIDGRDSLFWDKKAYAEGAWDWTKARIFHWLHQAPSGNNSARILESEKDQLDSRIWYNYPGQSTNYGAPYYLDAAYTGASAQPSLIARVLDDGSTQLSALGYNAAGNLTNYTDPSGRNFTFIYSTNNIDVLEARMTRNGKNELLRSATYNSQHHPLTLTDAAGQVSQFTYDSRGQILTMTDPKNETVNFTYDTNSFLTSIQGPLVGPNDTAAFTYDSFNRVRTMTDTEGYTITYDYDVFDRPVLKSYPDGTSEQLVYNRLDLVAIRDRMGRWATNSYDANRKLISSVDPLGRTTRFDWCTCGSLEGIIDAMGRQTSWTYDLQGRPSVKQFPDGSTERYTYDLAGRMRALTDANGQQTITDYYPDDFVKRVSYIGGTNPTPPVSFTYDPDYGRVLTMQDGVGMTAYAYNPITGIPTPGAGMLHSVSGPLPNSTVTYQYDQLGRITGYNINGAAQSFTYDILGRMTNVINSLGSFQYSYLNASARISMAVLPNGQTNLFTYYGNIGDQRVKQIQNLKANGSLLSSFGYVYDTVGQITAWTNTWDTLPTRVWLFSYDPVSQLTGAVRTDGVQPVSTNSYAYDAAGNRIMAAASGVTNNYSYNPVNQVLAGASAFTNGATYEWDSAHHMTAINYGAHRTEFTYDGDDRCTRIVEKQNGSTVANNTFLWCNDVLAEERDAAGTTVVRRFFAQGEVVLGAGATYLFYTRDHLGSIREAVDSSGNLQTRYDYDPYGRQTVVSENIATTFGFSGHFQHRQSGLYLAKYRGLDPNLGRWLNRDPITEVGGLNLYAYVNNNPTRLTDTFGLCGEGGHGGEDGEAGGEHGGEHHGEANEILEKAWEEKYEHGIRTAELVEQLVVAVKNGTDPHFHSEPGPIAVIGAVVATGTAVKEDYQNGLGVGLTVTDASATASSDLAVSFCPPVAMANIVTGGAPSAAIHNALATPNTLAALAFTRVNGREQDAIKKMYTRNWFTCAVWKAGEWLADKLVSDYKPPCP